MCQSRLLYQEIWKKRDRVHFSLETKTLITKTDRLASTRSGEFHSKNQTSRSANMYMHTQLAVFSFHFLSSFAGNMTCENLGKLFIDQTGPVILGVEEQALNIYTCSEFTRHLFPVLVLASSKCLQIIYEFPEPGIHELCLWPWENRHTTLLILVPSQRRYMPICTNMDLALSRLILIPIPIPIPIPDFD
jgi:hypothetical protein